MSAPFSVGRRSAVDVVHAVVASIPTVAIVHDLLASFLLLNTSLLQDLAVAIDPADVDVLAYVGVAFVPGVLAFADLPAVAVNFAVAFVSAVAVVLTI